MKGYFPNSFIFSSLFLGQLKVYNKMERKRISIYIVPSTPSTASPTIHIPHQWCGGTCVTTDGPMLCGGCSVTRTCPTLWDLMDCSASGFPSFTICSFFKLMFIVLVMPSSCLILCHPLLIPPSIFPSIRVFSSEWALHIRRPKHWSFRFSISPSNEYSGLISIRVDWFDLLAVEDSKTLKSLL